MSQSLVALGGAVFCLDWDTVKYLNLFLSVAVVLPFAASAQQYRFYMGPYGTGATNPAACNPQAEAWYSAKEDAC